MKKSLLFTFSILLSGFIFSQEQLLPLKYNSVLLQNMEHGSGSRSIASNRDTLCLPFLDDFSDRQIFLNETTTDCTDTINHYASAVYPSNLFWVDSNAFVNVTYPSLPPTYGVATLDGLNKSGKPYNEASTFAMADFLTSKPVYLGGGITDSVYLSFYYQPGGLGEYPNPNDSLILEFKTDADVWREVWYAVNTTGTDPQSFKLQMIPVDAEYQYNGFQFRFRNWAGVDGNNDHWHIDYVYLDDDRTSDDTLVRDVAIIYQPERYLKHYRQMPWNQFKDHQSDELASEHAVIMKNNFNTIVNTSYQYSAKEKYSGDDIVALTTPISVNLDPLATAYDPFGTFSIPSATPNYDADSMTVQFKYILDPAGDVNRRNDTMHYEQHFYNYFAYDDGTAEKAYALGGTGAKLAIRFFANEPDTLKEVYIHWAYVDGNKSNLFFSLMIWDDIDTTLATASENIIYQNDFLSPKYVDSINGFYVYKLVDFLGNPNPVVVDGYFYVGWLQSQDDFLNVGFDMNNDASGNVFYNIGGVWQKSILDGAIMIRPQVGGNYSMFSPVADIAGIVQDVHVYPNPAGEKVHIDMDVQDLMHYQFYDLAGNIIMQEITPANELDIAAFAPGFYLLKINNLRTGEIYTAKLIKQ